MGASNMRNVKGTLVCDCDEVLTNISPLFMQLVFDDREYFGKYLNLPNSFDYTKPEDERTVLNRPVFDLAEWLKKPGIRLSEGEWDEVRRRFMSLAETDDFYDRCTPTRMCITMHLLSMQRFVDKIYVVTRSPEGNRASKARFLENNIQSEKLRIVFVDIGKRKSDSINDRIGKFDTLFEDELTNVEDVIDNCENVEGISAYIPYYGYNHPDERFYEKCKKNKVDPLFYPNI
jgi:hypothetical protein